MNIRRASTVLFLLAVGVGSLTPVAAQTVPDRRLTCGMRVATSSDLHLHLDRTLYCRASAALTVVDSDIDDASTPTVTVDLRGNTLYGTGSNVGIDAWDEGRAPIQVDLVNGRVERFEVGMVSDGPSVVTDVKFVRNTRLGYSCRQDCDIRGSYFKANATGFDLSTVTGASIQDTTFSRNGVGARVASVLSQVDIERDVFRANDVGLVVENAQARVNRSVFVANDLAMRFLNDSDLSSCVTLTGNRLAGNRTDIAGNPVFC